MSALRIYISFHASLKNSVYALKLHFNQNPSFIKWTLGKSFQNWHINLPKDLAKVLEEKIIENDRFSRQNGEPVKALAKPAQSAKGTSWPIPSSRSRSGWEMKKTLSLSLPVAFLSQSRYLPSRWRFGGGLVDLGSVEGNGHLPNIKCSNG